MIIAIDFDGTLHTGKWPEIGAPAPYAIEVTQRLKADGHYLIIWTCSEWSNDLVSMVNWLLKHQIPFDRVNDNHPEQISKYKANGRKVYAHVYIDDKNLGGLPTWNEIYDIISEKVKPVWHYEL